MQFTLLTTLANQHPPIIVGNRNKPLYCNVPDSLSESLARARLVSALVAILLLSSSTSVSKDNTGKEECLCRDNLFFRAPETITAAKWQMSWKENSSLLRLWPYQGMKHTVSQNGEFIDRYC